VARRWTFWGTPDSGLDVAICARSRNAAWLEITEPLHGGWEAVHTLRRNRGAFRPVGPVLYRHDNHSPQTPCPKKIRRTAKIEMHFDEIRTALDSWAAEDLQLTSATDSMDAQRDANDASADKQALIHRLFGFDGLNIAIGSSRGRPRQINTREVLRRREAGASYAELADEFGFAAGALANAVSRDRRRGVLPPAERSPKSEPQQ
jgi:hypothetical protein